MSGRVDGLLVLTDGEEFEGTLAGATDRVAIGEVVLPASGIVLRLPMLHLHLEETAWRMRQRTLHQLVAQGPAPDMNQPHRHTANWNPWRVGDDLVFAEALEALVEHE